MHVAVTNFTAEFFYGEIFVIDMIFNDGQDLVKKFFIVRSDRYLFGFQCDFAAKTLGWFVSQ